MISAIVRNFSGMIDVVSFSYSCRWSCVCIAAAR
jgi:hypothetical protein